VPLDLDNRTPFSCAHPPMLAPNGANILRFVVRATYDIGPKGLGLSKRQAPIRFEDVYWGETGKSSLRYESDVSLEKPFVDLIVNGKAYAPHGRPATQAAVGILFQDRFVRQLRVTGDRRWHYGLLGWGMTDPEPFVSLPVTYDRAFGGADGLGSESRNRVGMGYLSKVGAQLEGMPVPNVEFPEQSIKSPSDRPRPAGIGILSRDWRDRIKYAGTYDDKWLESRFPLLPADFDLRFNQSAPEDQWLHGVRGGETIKVIGMTPDGVLSFSIPRGSMRLGLHYRRRSSEAVMPLDTILVDCERRQVELTWRATADIHGDPFDLRTMIVSTDSPELTPKDCGCDPRSQAA
jgi:hypothetical protein